MLVGRFRFHVRLFYGWRRALLHIPEIRAGAAAQEHLGNNERVELRDIGYRLQRRIEHRDRHLVSVDRV